MTDTNVQGENTNATAPVAADAKTTENKVVEESAKVEEKKV